MMVRAQDFRLGTTFEDGGSVYLVTECNIVKPGKGTAFVRARVRDLATGDCFDKTYGLSESFNKPVRND